MRQSRSECGQRSGRATCDTVIPKLVSVIFTVRATGYRWLEADVYSFFLAAAGDPAFQPRP